MFYINDFNVGHTLKHHIEITEELHNSFGLMSGDNSPIHNDSDFSKSSIYKKPIGYAFLITALLSRIYGTVFPGGSELCLSQTCSFKKEYYVGDTLEFVLKVIHKNDSMRIATIDNLVLNQDQEIIFSGQAIMQLILGCK
ncbi:MaoC/PaaZ C-terminal domain-containing protein [Prochlorococcus sp. MIT 1223]|uniref:MaoC/PaaZ C-terminal domain-containing protein n=1 Tax=Prochlorococcus sp. MIT 1223 TaxID=3096217 RepID=UPI002A759CE0|nr:MaoC/PaaZ C-terminal domain-containing protein [Prochlorococcus sp. MIT 1223]